LPDLGLAVITTFAFKCKTKWCYSPVQFYSCYTECSKTRHARGFAKGWCED